MIGVGGPACVRDTRAFALGRERDSTAMRAADRPLGSSCVVIRSAPCNISASAFAAASQLCLRIRCGTVAARRLLLIGRDEVRGAGAVAVVVGLRLVGRA